ncbi:MAG: DNA polymerase III subunit chi [Betaproteobacteria bacterium]|nr:MAG: DNA polymerase III subunit chi [Betaproteobacteria bacterium]
MTRIDFYFNAADRLQVACRLAGKAVAQRRRVVIFAPQAEVAQRIDRLLWTWPATGFVPHCRAGDALAAETPVLIAHDAADAASASEVLLNLDAACPDFFERYERLLEIVSQEDADRLAARTRYAWYRDRGYAMRSHDLAGAAAE